MSIPDIETPRFSDLEVLPIDEAFALTAAYNADSSPKKVNLGAGVYRDDDGKSWRLPSVIEAKRRLHVEEQFHEYLPIHGMDGFLDGARNLVFGNLNLEQKARISSIQTVSGTGANSLAALFLAHHLKPRNIWIPDPTWNNHNLIWTLSAPNVTQREYPYFDPETKSFRHKEMLDVLQKESHENDVLLLHSCAHNPTGVDPTKEQWKDIAAAAVNAKMFVVFDSAYQGFASGNPDDDGWSIRYFFESTDIDFAVCQSFSKSLGLYGERVGALHLISTSTSREAVRSHLIKLQRGVISNPPLFGARIVATVLKSPDLIDLWHKDLITMSSRIKRMRKALYDRLIEKDTPGSWNHINSQIGMFSYTGLTEDQVKLLIGKYHIYLMGNGRISISGLTMNNVDYVATAIHAVVTGRA